MTKHRHFILHKPFGYLSQFVHDGKKKNKKVLGELFEFPNGTMAIGRLDEDSEGLLLLTTDGKVSEFVRSKKFEKEYHVQLDGTITAAAIEEMKRGVEIGFEGKKHVTVQCEAFRFNTTPDYPPRIKKIRDDRHGPTSWAAIILTEGKFRQVRKMTAAVGFPTLRLIRSRIGQIELAHLEAGQVIEVETLY